ncbi:unannotated protein [freshwater metagenome]|uniref:Unannotated protein n=1 Tax=freshwater metagenome TaxID=449393 RepID=A0A6J7S4L0_9ZZZZ
MNSVCNATMMGSTRVTHSFESSAAWSNVMSPLRNASATCGSTDRSLRAVDTIRDATGRARRYSWPNQAFMTRPLVRNETLRASSSPTTVNRAESNARWADSNTSDKPTSTSSDTTPTPPPEPDPEDPEPRALIPAARFANATKPPAPCSATTPNSTPKPKPDRLPAPAVPAPVPAELAVPAEPASGETPDPAAPAPAAAAAEPFSLSDLFRSSGSNIRSIVQTPCDTEANIQKQTQPDDC